MTTRGITSARVVAGQRRSRAPGCLVHAGEPHHDAQLVHQRAAVGQPQHGEWHHPHEGPALGADDCPAPPVGHAGWGTMCTILCSLPLQSSTAGCPVPPIATVTSGTCSEVGGGTQQHVRETRAADGDPQAQANRWIRTMYKDNLDIVKPSNKDLIRRVEAGIRAGAVPDFSDSIAPPPPQIETQVRLWRTAASDVGEVIWTLPADFSFSFLGIILRIGCACNRPLPTWNSQPQLR